MKFQDFFDSNAMFHSVDDIKNTIKNSKNYNQEDPKSAQVLNFFSTSKQRTYLVATSERLYCILDDVRKEKPHINWSMPKSDVKGVDGLKLDITSRDKTAKIGLVDIGNKHRKWLYTKDLFPSKEIKASIQEFLDTAM